MRRFLRTIRERLENAGPYSFKGVQLINLLRSLPRWPKESFSQKAEDLLIPKLLGKSKGRYLDIGSYHPVIYSNTHKLFKAGWNGVNVDMSEETISAFRRFRPKDNNVCAALGDKTEQRTGFFMENGKKSPLNTLCKDTAKEWASTFGKNILKRPVSVFSLDDLFVKIDENPGSIEFLNIDIEGLDWTVLKQWPFSNARPKVICIEDHASSVDQVIASDTHLLLRDNNYQLKYWLSPSLLYEKVDK